MQDPEKIIEEVESLFEVEKGSILHGGREGPVSRARQVAMYLVRETSDLSYPAVGLVFNKEHTTILYACKKIEQTLDGFKCDLRNTKEVVGEFRNRTETIKTYTPRGKVLGHGINDSSKDMIGNVSMCRWSSMLYRCYGGVDRTDKRATVCEEWKTFSTFHDWYYKNRVGVSDQVEKDILNRHRIDKIYGPGTCLMVPHDVNSSVTFNLTTESYGKHCKHRSDRIDTFYNLAEKYKEEYPRMSSCLKGAALEMCIDAALERATLYP